MDINFQGTVAVLNDTHNPFQDQRALREVELFLAELQPELVLYPGDLNDFYQISKFDKNPQRADDLQKDLDSTVDMLTRHRKLLPNARMIMMDGNHEDRLRRNLWGNNPAYASLKCLEISKLYELDKNEIEHVEYEVGVNINGVFVVQHGAIIRAHSGYTAKGMDDKHGGSGMHGHSHRGGSYLKQNRSGIYGWYENFCLCSLEPDWLRNPDWHQGFSLVHFIRERFWAEPIPIIKRRFMYGGVLWGSGGKKRV